MFGAFTAGILLRLALQTTQHPIVEVVESKMDAIGFGFLIPLFFVVSGMALDLEALTSITGLLLT